MPPGTLIFPSEGLTIPAELCDIICQNPDLTPHDLQVLSAVSHNFRVEAQRFLYSSVELRNQVNIRLYCITVTRQPHFATYLRKLVLHMASQESVDPDDISRIVKTLRLSTNLKDLQILSLHPNHIGCSLQYWMLSDHTFKLTAFTNTYLDSRLLNKFFETQPTIETLRIERTSFIKDTCGFPRLKNLSCSVSVLGSTLHPHEAYRLEQLQLGVFPGNFMSRESSSLSWFFKSCGLGATMKSLSITKHGGISESWDSWTIETMMASAAIHFPDIRFLQITDYTLTPAVPDFSLPEVTMSFTQIETLILRPPTLHPDDSSQVPELSAWRDLRTDTGRMSIATKIMQALPMLKRLILGVPGSHNYEFKRISSLTSDLSEALVTVDPDEWLTAKL